MVAGDVLTCDLGAACDGRFRVYGNLPYYITSPILHRLFDCADRIDSIHIVIQLEVAERIVARPARAIMAILSVVCQFYTKPEIVLRIPPGRFPSASESYSALVQMTMPGERASLGIGPKDEEAISSNSFKRASGRSGRPCGTICAWKNRKRKSRKRSRLAVFGRMLAPNNSASRNSPRCSRD